MKIGVWYIAGAGAGESTAVCVVPRCGYKEREAAEALAGWRAKGLCTIGWREAEPVRAWHACQQSACVAPISCR